MRSKSTVSPLLRLALSFLAFFLDGSFSRWAGVGGLLNISRAALTDDWMFFSMSAPTKDIAWSDSLCWAIGTSLSRLRFLPLVLAVAGVTLMRGVEAAGVPSFAFFISWIDTEAFFFFFFSTFSCGAVSFWLSFLGRPGPRLAFGGSGLSTAKSILLKEGPGPDFAPCK
jgi:hypothetical protein